ncbi:hypothetical protein L3073_09425 [Ancylomarina sp. DW003]|nr:hypothetical protein [Ancylomarina sp. DW003]MDE5422425.1 hypothetical protein [Ancylomarina sp. DW003]
MDFNQYILFFNNKANKLLNLNFSKKLEETELHHFFGKKVLKIKLNQQIKNIKETITDTEGEGHRILEIGPTGEEFDSYILNLRLFIQNNDSLSINNLSKQYSENCTNPILVDKIKLLREGLNEVLDSNVYVYKENNSDEGFISLTSRGILDIYIYGEYGHTNFKKKNQYDRLKFGNNNNWSFFLSVKKINDTLKEIVKLNEEVSIIANRVICR